MTIDELDAVIAERPPVVEGSVDVSEILPLDPIISLSMALVVLQEAGGLIEDILESKARKGRVTLSISQMVELQQAADTIEEFLYDNGEEGAD